MGRQMPEIERTLIRTSKEKCDEFLNHPYRQTLLRGEVPHTDDPELLRLRALWAAKRAARAAKEAARKAEEAKAAYDSAKNLFIEDSDDDSMMASKFI